MQSAWDQCVEKAGFIYLRKCEEPVADIEIPEPFASDVVPKTKYHKCCTENGNERVAELDGRGSVIQSKVGCWCGHVDSILGEGGFEGRVKRSIAGHIVVGLLAPTEESYKRRVTRGRRRTCRRIDVGQLCLKERNLGAENDNDATVRKRKVLRSSINVAFQPVGTQPQFFQYSASHLLVQNPSATRFMRRSEVTVEISSYCIASHVRTCACTWSGGFES